EEQRKRARHGRLLDAEREDGAHSDLVVDLQPAHAAAPQLVRTELLVRVELEAEPVEAGGLERAHDDVSDTVMLRVQEGVADRDRHLVAKLRGAQGVGVDQDVRHRGTLTRPTSFQEWPTPSDVLWSSP